MPLGEASPHVAILVEDYWQNSNFRDELLSPVCVCRQSFKSKFENDFFDVPEGDHGSESSQNGHRNISVTTRYGHELFWGFCLCCEPYLSAKYGGKRGLTPGRVPLLVIYRKSL